MANESVACYGFAVPTSGTATGFNHKEFVTVAHRHRIRHAGNVVAIEFFVPTSMNAPNDQISGRNLLVSADTQVYFCVWRRRRHTTTYIRVGVSENLQPAIASDVGVATEKKVLLTLATPIPAEPGDFVGMKIVNAAGTVYPWRWQGNDTAGQADQFIVTGTVPDTTETGVVDAGDAGFYTASSFTVGGSSVESGTVRGDGILVPVQVYMTKAAQLVGIGDSLIAGKYMHHPYHEWNTMKTTGPATTAWMLKYDQPHSTIPAQLARMLGLTWRNTGQGGDTSAQILARLTTDCIDYAPQLVIVNGMVNDIGESVSLDTFKANWGLNNTNGILPLLAAMSLQPRVLVLLGMPNTGGSNTMMTTMDTWNTWLAAYAATFANVAVVDVRPTIGVDRAGGSPTPPSPNYWDVLPQYLGADNSDNTHLSAQGYERVAEAALAAYWAKWPIVAAASVVDGVPTGEYGQTGIYPTTTASRGAQLADDKAAIVADKANIRKDHAVPGFGITGADRGTMSVSGGGILHVGAAL